MTHNGQQTAEPPTVNFAAIPEELKRENRWVVWRWEVRHGKRTKVPYQAKPGRPRKAQANNSATWSTYGQAVAVHHQYDGVGFMLGDGWAGVDLDHCIDVAGTLDQWAAEIVETFNTYTEVSPSGTGLKMICRGSFPTDKTGGNSTKLDGKPLPEERKVEAYHRGRFFTVTGRAWRRTDGE